MTWDDDAESSRNCIFSRWMRRRCVVLQMGSSRYGVTILVTTAEETSIVTKAIATARRRMAAGRQDEPPAILVVCSESCMIGGSDGLSRSKRDVDRRDESDRGLSS